MMAMVVSSATTTSTTAASTTTGVAATATSLVSGSADLEDLVFKWDDDRMLTRERRRADNSPTSGCEIVTLDRFV